MFTKLKEIKLISIDFTKPWWQLFTNQKWDFGYVIFSLSILQIFWSLLPFLIAQIFVTQQYSWCLLFFGIWIILQINVHLATRLNQNFQLSCIHSIYQQAHQNLLTVDPRYHIHRASGALMAKIERCARGFEDYADYITYEFTPLIVGLLTIIVTLAFYSTPLSILISFFLVVIFCLSYYFATHWTMLGKKSIACDDTFKTTAQENLAQVHLIRATFSSSFRMDKLDAAIDNNKTAEALVWYSYTHFFTILNYIYICSLLIFAIALLLLINHNMMTVATAIGLFLAYIQSSKDVPRVMRLFRKTTQSLTRIKDLFEFMPTFGKQNFPVLGTTKKIEKPGLITVQANNICFDYGKAVLFNDHSFALSCSSAQHNKLYGIIGPSGSGKSTLISILGGQLKPTTGQIVIDGTDIYAVNDATRRQLIALQGQVATNLQGPVKNNLLLGIPETVSYTQQELLAVIERVGLLAVLQQHDGLNTILGEGGLNLSGGQRQRLNFAGLYLRAQYYKPSLILIDEPTSSLDEISEAAITQMINELSQSAITLVIAHRLKTIEQANGLIDLSMLLESKEIAAYSSADLLKKSHYYQQLLQGKIQLDS